VLAVDHLEELAVGVEAFGAAVQLAVDAARWLRPTVDYEYVLWYS
jgi:hypothetical protein